MRGDRRPYVVALLNIDLAAVGNWAERHNIAYGSYADLAQKPEVYELVRQELNRVNRSLGEAGDLAGAQIRKFLLLHKELDADDQEITRTRKVRRGFVGPEVRAPHRGPLLRRGPRERGGPGHVRGRPGGHGAGGHPHRGGRGGGRGVAR